MTVDIEILGKIISFLIFSTLGVVSLIAVFKVIRLVNNLNRIIEKNESNIDASIKEVPEILKDTKEITSNLKDGSTIVKDISVELTDSVKSSLLGSVSNKDTFLAYGKTVVDIVKGIFDYVMSLGK